MRSLSDIFPVYKERVQLVSLFLLLASLGAAQARISVLIVDGVNNHDWQTGTRELQAILGGTGRFRVDVSTSPARDAAAEEWARWRPQFSRYGAVLLNWNGGHLADGLRWPPEVDRALVDYVRAGGGLIVFHAANNAFLNWPEYNDMIGLGWRNKEFGPSLVIGPDEKVVRIPVGEGRNPGHGPRHTFEIHVLNADHPILRGLPRHWTQPSEQLTHGQHGPAEGLTILTYAWSKDVNENEPLDWVRSYGKGRVYTTMLGHTWKDEANPNFQCKEFQRLIAQGVEWAATGKVAATK
jgi:type 1 glutamine amidotransferase